MILTLLKRPHCSSLCLLCSLVLPSANAQDTTSYQELSQSIRAPNAVAKVGTDLFGDQINLYNGSLEFIQTDVNLRGNDALPVAVARRLSVGTANKSGRAFGLWNLEIPHLHGVFSQVDGWRATGGGQAGARCTNFGPPPTVLGSNQDGSWDSREFWQGSFVYIPGIGDQQMLKRTAANTTAPGPVGDFPVVTASGWSFSCLPTAESNPIQGEGFLAFAPDGTRYWFDHIATFPVASLSKSKRAASPSTEAAFEPRNPIADISDGWRAVSITPNAASKIILQRKEVWILPTKIADRFGNSVTYTYDTANPANLKTISASDGRSLAFSYGSLIPGNANGITSVTDGVRTWSYKYHGSYNTISLDSVTLPDGATWRFPDIDTLVADVTPRGTPSCEAPGFDKTARTGTMVHPSGAIGTFTIKPTLHGRSDVYRACLTDGLYWYPQVPKFFEIAP